MEPIMANAPSAPATPSGASGANPFTSLPAPAQNQAQWLAGLNSNPQVQAWLAQGFSPGDIVSGVPMSRFNAGAIDATTYAPGKVAGTPFPTWNVTPGNIVSPPSGKIPYFTVPYAQDAPGTVQVGSRNTGLGTGQLPIMTGLGGGGLFGGGGSGNQNFAGFSNFARNAFGPQPVLAAEGSHGILMRRGGSVKDQVARARLRTLLRMRRRMRGIR